MAKRERTGRALQQELSRRIQRIDDVIEDGTKIGVPLPQPHPRDARGRNWDIRTFGNATGYERSIRTVVDKARDEFDLVEERAGADSSDDPFAGASGGSSGGPSGHPPANPFGN